MMLTTLPNHLWPVTEFLPQFFRIPAERVQFCLFNNQHQPQHFLKNLPLVKNGQVEAG